MTLAYNTLINPEAREEYDDYLASVGSNREKVKDEEMDPEEIERRRRERGKQRFMDDFDFLNDEFFESFKNRTKKSSSTDSFSD
jgi:curved DNA-binding protein CbpA